MSDQEHDRAIMNGAMRFEEQRQAIRQVYLQGFGDIADRCLAEFVMPEDQATICADMAQFTAFLMVIKIVENRCELPTLMNLQKAFKPVLKAIERELPGMFMEYVRSVQAEKQALARMD